MKPNFLKILFGVLLSSSLLVYCKKSSDIIAESYTTEKEWIHANGGIYKNETLTMKSTDGSIKIGSLNWSSVNTFKIGQAIYTEIPFNFPTISVSRRTNNALGENVSFSLMIRTVNGKTEAAVKFTQRNVMIKNATTEKLGTIECYSTLEGVQLNMWFTDDAGKLMKMRKQNQSNITANSIAAKTSLSFAGDGGCISFNILTYDYQCWITGGAYNETACGWMLVGSYQYLLCFDSGSGGGWPSIFGGGSETPAQNQSPNTPCNGDALADPKIAPSSITNKNGGRFGPTRINANGTSKNHYGIDLSAVPNTPVYAAYGGTVTRSEGSHLSEYYGGPKSFGNLVEIESTLPDGKTVKTLYAHLNATSVPYGSTVVAGDQIGLSGRTGNAQRVKYPHVHVQMNDESTGKPINPESYLSTKFDNQGNSTGRPCN